jgi:hypothetical protein
MAIKRSENPPADQATTTIPPGKGTPRSNVNLTLERRCACWEAAQRSSELAGGQAAAINPHEPLQHEPLATAERILMMDYATTKAQPEGVTPILRR